MPRARVRTYTAMQTAGLQTRLLGLHICRWRNVFIYTKSRGQLWVGLLVVDLQRPYVPVVGHALHRVMDHRWVAQAGRVPERGGGMEQMSVHVPHFPLGRPPSQ
eukprot:scaffold9596_cov101-Isochrysis_galbana.AAC.1